MMTRRFRSLLLAGTLMFAVAPLPTLAQDDPVLANVNGKAITRADLDQALVDLDQQFQRLPADQRQAAALSALIEISLMADRAEKEGYAATPEFERRMAFLRARALHEQVVEKDVAAKVGEDEVRARYDKEVAATPPQNEVKARHILVKTEEEAKAIIAELDGGADFATIAKEKSTGPSGPEGGELGYFGAGQMVPEFEAAAFALAVGQHSKTPVQTQFGWHIIEVQDKRLQQPPAYEQVKEQMRSVVLRERYVELARELRQAGTVEILDPALKAAVDGQQAAPVEGAEPAKN
jgi:peptidyl-prolyl cis-trans isomerase C